MPDVTHRIKADKYLAQAEEFEAENGGMFANAAMTKAAVHASLAVGQSLREIDAKLKWTTDQIGGAIHSTSPLGSRWLSWRDEDDQIVSMNVGHILFVQSVHPHLSKITTDTGATVEVPLSFGEVSLQVGN